MLTAAWKLAMKADRELHRSWLQRHAIVEPSGRIREEPYTGLLLAALLDPDARPTVTGALLDGNRCDETAGGRPLTHVSMPTQMVDLVLGFGHQPDIRVALVEHKRFHSPANAPGYRTNPDADWQTDQAYEGALATVLPRWLAGVKPGQVHDFVVLDAYGRSMDDLYKNGRYNDLWRVVGYARFGAILRSAHDAGVRGLLPLLAALYADSD